MKQCIQNFNGFSFVSIVVIVSVFTHLIIELHMCPSDRFIHLVTNLWIMATCFDVLLSSLTNDFRKKDSLEHWSIIISKLLQNLAVPIFGWLISLR